MVGLVAFAVLIAITAVPGSGPEAPLVAAGGDEIQLGLNSSLALLAAVGYLLVIDRPLFRPVWFAAGIFLAGTVLAAGSRAPSSVRRWVSRTSGSTRSRDRRGCGRSTQPLRL